MLSSSPALFVPLVSQEKLSEYVNTRLKPLALEAARCNVGSAASEAAWLHGGQHITEAAASEVHRVMELTRGFTDQWRLHKQCIQGRLESLADSPEEANTVRGAGERGTALTQTRQYRRVTDGNCVFARLPAVAAGPSWLAPRLHALRLLLTSSLGCLPAPLLAACVPHLHGQGEPHREAHLRGANPLRSACLLPAHPHLCAIDSVGPCPAAIKPSSPPCLSALALSQILSYVQQAAQFNSAIPKQLGDGISPAELAWVNEVAKGQKQAMELLARILAIIAEARLASLHICLQAFVQLLDVLAMWTTASSASFAQREAWMRSYMSVHGGGNNAFLIFKGPEVKEPLMQPPQSAIPGPHQCPQIMAVEAEVRKLAAH